MVLFASPKAGEHAPTSSQDLRDVTTGDWQQDQMTHAIKLPPKEHCSRRPKFHYFREGNMQVITGGFRRILEPVNRPSSAITVGKHHRTIKRLYTRIQHAGFSVASQGTHARLSLVEIATRMELRPKVEGITL